MQIPIPVRAAAFLLLLVAGGMPGVARAGGIAFVINSNDASISEIDVSTQKEIRRIPVLREPHHMALTPDGKSLVIGDTAGNALFFLDPHTGEVQRQIPMSDPYQITFSPDGKLAHRRRPRAQPDRHLRRRHDEARCIASRHPPCRATSITRPIPARCSSPCRRPTA